MKNEQIVQEIQNGFSVTANMELLYTSNLPLIKKFIRPYTNYEPEEDLLQEAYFGLVDAVHHYRAENGVLFMTYARYWICQRAQRYIDDCGSIIRLPGQYRQKINRYKKSVQEYQQIHNKVPTDNEIAAFMCVSVSEIRQLKLYMADVQSIDKPLNDSEDLSISDTLQADFNLENSTTDKIYDEYQKSELWGIVEHYTNRQQADILTEHFKNNKTLREIAEKRECSVQWIRQQKEGGLHKLRTGKAVKEIREKFEIIEASAYRSGIGQYRSHDSTSVVEYIALRRAELEERYKRALSG